MDIKAYIESGAIESYVLGLASIEEAAEVELFAAQYADIKKAIDDFSTSIEQNVIINAIPPAAELKQKIFTVIKNDFTNGNNANVATAAPVIPLMNEKIETSKVVSFWKYAAVASVILLVTSTALNFYFYSNYKTVNNQFQALLTQKNSLQAYNEESSDKIEVLRSEKDSLQTSNSNYKTRLKNLNESMAIIKNPDMKIIRMKGIPGRGDNLATIYWNNKTKDVYLLANKMQKTPSDKQYQLWAIVKGKPVSAGIFGECEVLCKMKNIPKAQAFAVTLEQKGGSLKPTLTQMYVIGKT